MKTHLLLLSAILATAFAQAQDNYWQQRVEYDIDISFDDQKHQYAGTTDLRYFNNSPDTLFKVYFHLYPNAFQPGSMMDMRSRSIEDPDPRVGKRIAALSVEDQGYLHIKSLTLNGDVLETLESGTILEVSLAKPILPGKKVRFAIDFEGQVPIQVRRSGRYNQEGVAYSMAQWYPRMAAYDMDGWHADPYIGREFYGVWGDFDVSITIDSAYTIGGTGILQNPKQIGHGYLPKGQDPQRPAGNMLTWEFKAEKVHDFVWAADKNYRHDIKQMEDGPELHFFYKNEADLLDNWSKLQDYTVQIFEYANTHFGKYPWSQYSVIQGGDGGMEYPMATLITGQRSIGSLVGVTAHEVMHSWYQGALASYEGKYPWLDEGFTQFTSSKIMSHLFNPDEDSRTGRYYDSYFNITAGDKNEPLSTQADWFKTNYAYGANSYGTGAVLLAQLGYIVGDAVMMAGLKRYFNTWKFRHPKPDDFIRVMEKTSGLELKWYLEEMLNITDGIDYAIAQVEGGEGSTRLLLKRIGNKVMPIDLVITYRDGSKETINIPLVIMRGAKHAEGSGTYTVAANWPWVNPTYSLTIAKPIANIASIEIDESQRLADSDRSNNKVVLSDGTQIIITN